MNRTGLVSMLVVLLLAFSASAARAAPLFTLTMTDCGADLSCAAVLDNTTVTLSDNVSPDMLSTTSDKMAFGTRAVGGFSVMTGIATTLFNTALSPAGPVQMTLPITFKVSTSNANGGVFQAILFHSDLTSALLVGPFAQASVVSNVSMLPGASASVSFKSSLDTNNQAFQASGAPAGAVQLVSSGNNVPVVSDGFALAADQKFSLYSKMDFVFGAAGSVNASTDFQVNAVPTPEPGTMMLFGAGVLGLTSFGRRRSKKSTYQRFPERGAVMKKTVVLSVLVGLLLSFNASPARAEFILTVTDVTSGDSLSIADGDALDFDGSTDIISSMGAIGGFEFQFSTGAISTFGSPNCPTPGQVCMDLGSYIVTNALQTGGQFEATLVRTDLNKAAYGLGSSAQARAITKFSPTVGTNASATFQSWVDPTNTTDGIPDSVNIPTDGLLFGPIDFTGGPLFSMYSQLNIVFANGAGASASGDTSLHVLNAVSTPEPGTMMLFGSGLGMFGLASLRRCRSKMGV